MYLTVKVLGVEVKQWNVVLPFNFARESSIICTYVARLSRETELPAIDFPV